MRNHRPSLRTRLAVLLVATVGLGAAHGGGIDLAPFIGNWSMPSDSEIGVFCGGNLGFPAAFNADSAYPFTVSAGTDSDLVLHVSCHCDLPLTVFGQQARLVASPTACNLIMVHQAIKGTVTDATLDLSVIPPTLVIYGVDGEGLARRPYLEGTGTCSGFRITGTPSKTSDTPTLCGPDDTAVGVIPYTSEGTVDCTLKNDVGREAVDIFITTNSDATCPHGTGEHGEGGWVLPQAVRPNQPCNPVVPPDPAKPPYLGLQFCRVDGRGFKPLTIDANATDQFYAVLMLGSQCPNGSERVRWQIDTPDAADFSSCVGGPPETPCGPNQTLSGGSAATTFWLNFCLFRSASTAEGTMASFPTLGWSYGVFHDFDGPQPAWVMMKRWVYSLQGAGNRLMGAAGVDLAFSKIVEETTNNGLYFEMARVH
jgi:hypothetical protein